MAKYSEEKVDAIVKMIEHGVPNKYAALANDVSEFTFYDWIKNKPTFSKLVKKAEGKRIASLVLLIKQDNSWQSKAWMLERADRDTFHLPTGAEKEMMERIEKLEGLLAKKERSDFFNESE